MSSAGVCAVRGTGALRAVTGKTTSYGYYTISLPQKVSVAKGDRFSVVIEFDDRTELQYGVPQYYVGGSESGTESAMVRNLAGYSFGRSDLVRRAMAKKKKT